MHGKLSYRQFRELKPWLYVFPIRDCERRALSQTNNNNMERRCLGGDSELSVSPICLGTWQFGGTADNEDNTWGYQEEEVLWAFFLIVCSFLQSALHCRLPSK